MKISEETRVIQRYIALDIHKEYVLAGGMSALQEWLLPPRKIEMGRFREWVMKNLCETDPVVIETTTNVWEDIAAFTQWHALTPYCPVEGVATRILRMSRTFPRENRLRVRCFWRQPDA